MKLRLDPCGGVDRVLLVQLRNLGDVLLCTPAVRALKQACPKARIDFLTGAAGADALRCNPHLDEVLVWSAERGARWRMLRELRRRSYDAVLDFQSHPRTYWIVWATGAPRRIGIRKRGPRNLAYTHLVPRVSAEVYQPRQKLALLSPLGVAIDPTTADACLEVAVGAAERARAEEIFARHGLAGERPVVAVSAVSKLPVKQWGVERWAVVADALADAGARLLFTSGPGERAQAEAGARRMRNPAVWDYGPTTIPELAALYERCVLWVGNDGGALHVAAAAGIPTLSIIHHGMGPTWIDASPGSPHCYLEGAGPTPDGRGGIDALAPAKVAGVALDALKTTQRPRVGPVALGR
ncbi:MAG: glycosyltransferase family 9 protein [Gemmatimonadetes bacterium]|nr:glycosyltransferase family 9 protein [Gemmatimonadota bacterium]